MSPTRISIDLCASPLRVGGLLLGKYLVTGGSKEIKLTGPDASTRKEEVLACLEDARSVVKGYFGAPAFDAAVVVIPNTTSKQHLDDIISYGRGASYNITQVIHEHAAVSAAYIEKVKPTDPVKIAIISLSSSFLEVSVISINPVEFQATNYNFLLEMHKALPEAIDFEDSKHDQESSGGLIGFVEGAVKGLVVEPFSKAVDLFSAIVAGNTIQAVEIKKVVFVGKAATSEKVRRAAEEVFPDAVVWEGVNDPEDVAAYGAAYLSFNDKVITIQTTVETASVKITPWEFNY